MAGEFAQLADRLRSAGYAAPRVAHFLIRLLFCLFAEDVGLLPDRLFGRLVERTRRQPAAFDAQLRQLFAAMSTGGWFGADQVPHFDGGLFDDDSVLALDEEALHPHHHLRDLPLPLAARPGAAGRRARRGHRRGRARAGAPARCLARSA
jgi:hypothetical protein